MVKKPCVVLLGEDAADVRTSVSLCGSLFHGLQIVSAPRKEVEQCVLSTLCTTFLEDGKLVPRVEYIMPAPWHALCSKLLTRNLLNGTTEDASGSQL